MSSTYRWICIDHTPPLILDEIDGRLGSPMSPPPRPGEHPECKLVMGRWSGGLIEINFLDYRDEWIDVSWFRRYPQIVRKLADGAW